MNPTLKKLLSFLAPRRREYLAVDENFNILETSLGVERFADCPDEVLKGKDVRIGFPELIGLEDIFIAILQRQEFSYELKGIGRFSEQCEPLYFDIYVINNPDDNKCYKKLIIFLEDVTEKMVLEQTLVQADNEKSLLLSALSVSKNYVDTIITSMADSLLVTSKTGVIKTINRAAEVLFGYPKEELISHSIQLIIDDFNFIDISQAKYFLDNKFLKNVEVVCKKKTGEKIVVAFSCSVIHTEEEGVQDLIYIGRDITEHQRARQRQAVQYTTTRILSESATIKQALQTILQAICESLGWDLGEIWTLGRAWGEGGEVFTNISKQNSSPASPELRCVENWVRPSIAMPEFTSVTSQTTFAPGEGLPGHVWARRSPHWISDVTEDANFLRSESASLAGLHGAFGFPIQGDSELLGVMTFYSSGVQRLDEELLKTMAAIGNQLGQFIKRKQAEAALAESEERYRDLFENATDLIQSCALNGQFLYVNRAWRETLGYSEAQVQQMNLFDIIHPDCKAQNLEIFSRVISGERIVQVQASFISKRGKKISVEGNINCKYIAGKPVATRAIFRDITERLQAEEALRHQQQQTERLLLNILPEPIADRLKQETSTTIAEDFAEVSVMFADIVGFTQMASSLSPIELIDLLNQIFSAFDRLSEKHGLEKIKTVGDAYMVVGGLPTRRADHAEAIAEMALDIQSAIAKFREETGKDFNIRIGINTGPVVAGVIGIKKFSYDLWGDTVNIASRMESHGIPGQVQVTPATYERLREQYLFQERGAIQVKGKGEMTTYFLMGRKAKLKTEV